LIKQTNAACVVGFLRSCQILPSKEINDFFSFRKLRFFVNRNYLRVFVLQKNSFEQENETIFNSTLKQLWTVD